ncbi:protein BANP-like [Centruroides sculpturatus]|uniref:protein BANP-like n=1 Tax=Centruroides sculpturatus TaxID=218467 RepID=UPI000C6CC300|nr:protein BANP-like [Centruroides sculpturatus]XP_023214956.1 protein BANP-like [Centruroides sculpturatus]XP_023214962.1 protein BANP-like [Centruroides sculpturatus]XP_023214971.1 protein BANP-like [Centruroides sculpturatus]XP_023214981.1 protein BANP-like [Centruroides sculpturatus]XP_023214986.1 protein BANP-like [Centruroides sculpturatus]
MTETDENISSLDLNERNSSDNIRISNMPITTSVLVMNQGVGVLTSENMPDLNHPVKVLAINNEYLVTRLKNEDIEDADNNSFLTFSNNLSSNVAICNNELSDIEHNPKRKKISTENCLTNEALKKILAPIQQAIIQRLENIERKVENVNSRCQCLEEKVESVVCQIRENGYSNRFTLSASKGRTGTIIIGVPPSNQTETVSRNTSSPSVGSNVQLITLNSAADYPNGSWLGDPENPEMRVRCHIVPSDLENINKSCTSPEKLALTLLDYLFDRETQACSNISGTGRHGKKQLDPLKIYGIRCHLIYKFNITEKDWHRIKQNLDSKCRTAFRRKQKGMPLTVKAFRDRLPPSYLHLMPGSEMGSPPESPSVILTKSDSDDLHSISANETELGMDNSINLNHGIPMELHQTDSASVSLPLNHIIGGQQVIQTEHGEIQVVHATPEQFIQMQQSQQIQIFAGTDVLKELQDSNPADQS